MAKMTEDDFAMIKFWAEQSDSADETHKELIAHIEALQDELWEYRNPVQEVVTLSMSKVNQLLTAAGWICYDDGHRFNRGLERVTVTYTNGVFRWAWKDGTWIKNFNDLLRVN